MYKYPLSILDSDIDHVDPTIYGVTIVDFLEYHYDASLIYIGNKQFERALDFLSIAISAPANIPSAIQFEAYKKYCLVSLIQDGKLQLWTRDLSFSTSTISQLLRPMNKPI
ncbi:hypothetical protein F4703DRAFT_1329016 [Phycomyces blakesleeanus]